MKDLESNKIFASVLIAGIAILVVSNLVDILYHPKQTTEYGYVVEVEAASSNTAARTGFDINNIDIGTLLANADLEGGKKISKKCTACHTFEKGAANKVGPNLWGIVDNKKAHLGDKFNYSKGLKEAGGTWDYGSLLQFLHKPSGYIKGTKMSFAGISKEQQLGDILLYLRSMSDNLSVLPKPQQIVNTTEGQSKNSEALQNQDVKDTDARKKTANKPMQNAKDAGVAEQDTKNINKTEQSLKNADANNTTQNVKDAGVAEHDAESRGADKMQQNKKSIDAQNTGDKKC